MKKIKISSVQNLLDAEDNWESSYGGAYLGQRAVFRGRDMFSEFKDYSWIELLYFCLKGEKPSNEAIKFLNGLYSMCFNYPDPRIWCNRIAALAGTTSSTSHLGVCAGSAVTEAKIYGGPTGIKAMDFLLRLKKDLDSGGSLGSLVSKEIKTNRAIFGYGRPLNPVDERVKPALRLLAELKLDKRKYITLALEVEKFLLDSKFNMHINIAGVFAAFCADDGLKREDINYLTIVSFSTGMLACYLDACDKPVGSFFPLRCERISYEGISSRTW